VVALFLADSGKDLPGNPVAGADLLVDPQEVGWDVAPRGLRGRISNPSTA
jgi:hypothetical protein